MRAGTRPAPTADGAESIGFTYQYSFRSPAELQGARLEGSPLAAPLSYRNDFESVFSRALR
jgi:hypothetical protein